MTKKIYQIGDYRRPFDLRNRAAGQRCYCDALRSRRDFFSSELQELGLRGGSTSVLRIEDLEYGIPANPSPVYEGWDLIYSSELLGSLPAVAARQVIRFAATKLNPGGRLLMANVSLNPRIRQCSRCNSEGQTYRGELEMAELVLDIPEIATAGQAIFRDFQGFNVFLELHKAPAAISICA